MLISHLLASGLHYWTACQCHQKVLLDSIDLDNWRDKNHVGGGCKNVNLIHAPSSWYWCLFLRPHLEQWGSVLATSTFSKLSWNHAWATFLKWNFKKYKILCSSVFLWLRLNINIFVKLHDAHLCSQDWAPLVKTKAYDRPKWHKSEFPTCVPYVKPDTRFKQCLLPWYLSLVKLWII